jgi:hypothetical protein
MISMVTIGYFTLMHAINALCICLAVLAFKVTQARRHESFGRAAAVRYRAR